MKRNTAASRKRLGVGTDLPPALTALSVYLVICPVRLLRLRCYLVIGYVGCVVRREDSAPDTLAPQLWVLVLFFPFFGCCFVKNIMQMFASCFTPSTRIAESPTSRIAAHRASSDCFVAGGGGGEGDHTKSHVFLFFQTDALLWGSFLCFLVCYRQGRQPFGFRTLISFRLYM